jgi:hypothetical protein
MKALPLLFSGLLQGTRLGPKVLVTNMSLLGFLSSYTMEMEI